MNLRTHTLVGLLALALAAAGCSAETSAETPNEESEIVARPLSTAALKTQLGNAVQGLWFVSEGDAQFDVFVAPGTPGAAVEPAEVRTSFSGLEHTTDEYDGTLLKDLKGATTRDFDEWVASDLDVPDNEADADMLAYKKGMNRARDLMKRHLTNLTVVYLAADPELSNQHSDVGTVHIFLAGRARDGSLVALHTIAAWT